MATSEDAHAIASTWTDALSADDSTIATHWTSPGMDLYRVPRPAEMRALLAISDVVALIDVDHLDTFATSAGILADIGTFKVSFMQLGATDGSLGDDAPDARLAEGIQAAFDSGASTIDWFSASHQSTLTKGECGTFTNGDGSPLAAELQTHTDDEWFLGELTAVGFLAPADLRAGMCVPVQ